MRRYGPVLALVLAAAPCAAATLEDSAFLGSRRGAFLGQAVGARAVGMGEAFTAVADDATAGYWNPGGLGQLTGLNATAMYNAAGGDIGFSHVSAASPLGPGVAGGSITVLSFGSYIRRDGSGARLGTGSVSDVAGAASYAMKHPGPFGKTGSTGATLEAVNETVGGALVGLTVGSVFPAARGFSVGWAAQHLSPKAKGFTLPAALKIGGAYDVPGLMRAALDFGVGLASQGSWFAAGFELAPHAMVCLRAGYKWRSQDLGFRGLSGLTAGAGFRYESLGVDYAYQPYGDLVTCHRVALSWGLPPSAVSPDVRLMREAAKLYKEGAYAGAEARVEVVLNMDSENWKAWQLLGNCKYARKDRIGAVAAWERSLELHPNNASLRSYVDRLLKKAPAKKK